MTNIEIFFRELSLMEIILIIAVIALFIIARQSAGRFKKLTSPVYDQIVSQAEAQASQFRQKAKDEAETIKAEAIKESQKYLNQTKGEIDEARQKFATDLGNLFEDLNKSTLNNGDQIKNLSNQLSEETTEVIKQVSEETTRNIEQILEVFKTEFKARSKQAEDSLEKFRQNTEEQLVIKFEQELKQVKQELEDYKQARLNVIDEHLVTLVERTTQITLNQALSGEDHLDIIKRSLAEAKKTNLNS